MKTRPPCAVDGCERVQASRVLCAMHAERLRKGRPLGPAQPTRVVGVDFADLHHLTEEGCWEWTGAMSTAGYGRFKKGYAHRHSYELARGPIPDGLVIDHLCRNRWCVNPEHLEAVTQRSNILRGVAPSALSVAMNRCARGHEFSPENTRIRPTGARRCIACQNIDNANRRFRVSA